MRIHDGTNREGDLSTAAFSPSLPSLFEQLEQRLLLSAWPSMDWFKVDGTDISDSGGTYGGSAIVAPNRDVWVESMWSNTGDDNYGHGGITLSFPGYQYPSSLGISPSSDFEYIFEWYGTTEAIYREKGDTIASSSGTTTASYILFEGDDTEWDGKDNLNDEEHTIRVRINTGFSSKRIQANVRGTVTDANWQNAIRNPYSVGVTDAQQGWRVYPYYIYVDADGPNAPGSLDMTDSYDEGADDDDEITWQSNPRFEWSKPSDQGYNSTGTAGTKDYYYWTVTRKGSSTKLADDYTSSTSVRPGSRSDGEYTFWVCAQDNVGNWGEWASIDYTIDTVDPNTPTGLTNPANPTSDTTPNATWSAPSNTGSSIWKYEIHFSDGWGVGAPDRSYWSSNTTLNDYEFVDGSDNPYPLPEGDWSWKVKAWDVAGNEGSWSGEKSLTVHTNATPNAPSFNTTPPSAIYPTKTYTVTVDYTDPDGQDDLQHVYLRIAQGDNENSQRLTLMHSLDTGWKGQWSDEGQHVSFIDVSGSNITNGYRVTWTFRLDWEWAESSNVDFYAWALDFDGADSSHTKYSCNAVYEDDLVIFGSTENADPITVGQTYTVSGQVIFEGTTSNPVAPDTWTGVTVGMDEGSVGSANRASDTSVSGGYDLSWTPTASQAGTHTLYIYPVNTNNPDQPTGSDVYYDVETVLVESMAATVTGFSTPTGTIARGTQQQTQVVVRNAGTTNRSFWVGLSFAHESTTNDAWPARWYDIHPLETAVLSPGAEQTVTFTFTVPDNLLPGQYYARTRVWDEFLQDEYLMAGPIADSLDNPAWEDGPNGTGETSFTLGNYEAPLDSVTDWIRYLARFVALEDPNLELNYRNGQKPLFYVEAGASGTFGPGVTVGLEGSFLIDLADLFQVTPEGQEGWVTTWVDASASLGLGASAGLDWDMGIVTHDFTFSERALADDREELNIGLSTNVPGFAITLVEWSSDGGFSGPRIEWTGDWGMGLSVNGSASGLLSYELRLPEIEAAFSQARTTDMVTWASDVVSDLYASVGFRDTTQDDGAWELFDGVFEGNLSLNTVWPDAPGVAHYFFVDVLAGASQLQFNTNGGTGDADLYVRHGHRPSITGGSYDYRSIQAGNAEAVTIPTPTPGRWHVMLPAVQRYEGLNLVASIVENHGPTDVLLSSAGVQENRPIGTAVGTLSTTDEDVGDTFTYALASGTGSADNGSFTISGNQLRTAVGFNYEAKNTYSIRVRSTDQGELYIEKVFTINVSNLNEEPTDISLSNTNIAENQPAGTAVGTLTTTDPDSGDSFSYSLVSGTGGADNSSFSISGNELRTAAPFDYEAKSAYSIRVRTTDQGRLYAENVFVISVTDVAEQQGLILSPTSLSVPEGNSRQFTVRLWAQPSSNVRVGIARTSGDSDLSASPATLTFTPSDWDTPQDVTVTAAQDPDTANGTATFTVSSHGLVDQTVTATEADDDRQSLVVSPTSLSVPEGGIAQFGVKLGAQPPSNVTVDIARTSGDTDLSASPATLGFTPSDWDTPQDVTVSAAQDPDTTNGTATFAVSSAGLASQTVTATEVDDDQLGELRRFDFGTSVSPVRSGYTRVAEATGYSRALGYGWQSGSRWSYDRRTPDALTRDFNYTRDATFAVDVPDGTYDVTVILGDLGSYAHDQMQVYLEGARVDTVTTPARQVVTRTYEDVAASDGQLTVRLRDGGGSDPNVVIEALEVTSDPDTTPPTVTGQSPVPGSTIPGLSVDIDVTFSEPVVGVDASDLVLSGVAAIGASVGTPTNPSGNTWRFPVSGLSNGTLNLSLAPDANDIEDAAENDLANVTWSYTVQDDPPEVTGRLPAPGSTIASSSANIDVTFSETVVGVDATDLVLSGAAAAGASVGTPTDQGGNTWRLPVSGLAQGSLDVSLAPDAGDIQDTSGQDLAPVTWSYTVDLTTPPFEAKFDFGTSSSPVESGYERVHRSTTYGSHGSLTYGWKSGTRYDYDRRTGTYVSRDFVYARDATFEVAVPDGTYDVTVMLGDMGSYAHDNQGIYLEGVRVDTVTTSARQVVTRTYEDVAVSDGQLTVRLRDGGGSDPNVVIEALEVVSSGPDTTPPVVTNRVPSPGSTIPGLSVDIDVTFSEPVVGVDSTDLALSGAAASSAMVGTPSNPSGNTWRFPVSGLTDGDLYVSLASDANDIEDAGGNDLANVTWSYTVDLSGPPPFEAHFDFGTFSSPVESGYGRVTHTTGYGSHGGLTYGWVSGRRYSYDRRIGTYLTRDFVYTPDATFEVAVPDGTYDVTVTVGDLGSYAHDSQGIYLEGALAGTISTAAGQVATRTYLVTVSDGRLTLRLDDLGGSDPNVVIEALEVVGRD